MKKNFPKQPWNYKKTAVFITILLALTAAACILAILCPSPKKGSCIADIYQDGKLLTSIPLDQVQESYRFTVTGAEQCFNEIEVRPGSIGIVNASCPDKLCIHQGFVDDSALPVVCLPNKLVIRMRDADSVTVDIISY